MATGQEFSITDEWSSDRGPLVIGVAGELDLNTSRQLRDHLAERRSERGRAMVVDLSAVPFMDSSAVGVLLEGAAATRAAGGGFAVVVGDRTHSRSRLDLTGTSRVLNVCLNLEEALELLAGGGGGTGANAAMSGTIELVLFFNGESPNAPRARAAAEEIRKRLPATATLTQVDVHERPELAEEHRVLATPMVVRTAPPPQRRVVGDMSNVEDALLALDLPAGP